MTKKLDYFIKENKKFFLMNRSDFLFDTLLEARPTFLPAERFQTSIDPILHHGDELLQDGQPLIQWFQTFLERGPLKKFYCSARH
jgi:hypothetical protein